MALLAELVPVVVVRLGCKTSFVNVVKPSHSSEFTPVFSPDLGVSCCTKCPSPPIILIEWLG